ncbi:hypothetical protein CB1_000155006 [Camelus ferus]|nr:hypothetical protein CB1_000155006 [Camelus ferus]
MKARRNKKQVPSFRKLLKTSKVKLENKLKNKQFKQQSTLKKYRKEQRKLRQAVRDAVSKKPVPLEDPKEKRPEIIEEPIRELTLEEHLIERKKKLQEKKMHIAALASAIISDPESNIKKLKELRSMLMEQDPDVAVTVRKLVTVSLMELFKDITPSYKIRPLTEAEKSTKIRKETQKLREFEEGLVSQYKFYLENLEQMVKDWKQRKLKKSNVVSLKAYKGLAEVAVKSLCELLVALPHFNFHNNIIVLIVPLMNDVSKSISEMCCEAVKKLFKQDKLGQASLGVIKVISGFVKGRNYEVRPEDLSYQESLHCVQTAFHILSGQGDVLNIDPMKFYTHLYKTLFKLHAGATNEGVEIVLQCLDVMLTKRRKQVSQQRALAFIKRLCTLALHVLPNSSIGILATNRILMHRHYHPIVQRFAAHLIAGAPSEGSEALKPELSRRWYLALPYYRT